MQAALERHDQIIESLTGQHHGCVVKPHGEVDSRFCVFSRATDAVAAAAGIQQALQEEPWPTPTPLKVRLALHTGEADLRDGDYFGSAINRCARLRAVAYGGQTLLSLATYDLVREALGPDVDARDLGEHRLKDLSTPERIYQLMSPGLLGDFPSLVPQAVTSAMGVLNTAGRPPLQLLTRFLASKKTLLLLDNCEHLVAACADLTDRLLKACPRLQILATIREGLRLAVETTWPVPSLSMPSLVDGKLGTSGLSAPEQYESIKLFVERAKAVEPAFELTEKNVESVAQLCHRLDGIPLAIELAAGCTRVLRAEQLLDRVQDRFRLLTGGSRTPLPRQQTLRALVDWSYDLLSEEERLLFVRLSGFAGGWTLEAAEAVCADDGNGGMIGGEGPAHPLRSDNILDLLGHLVEKSMVVAETASDGTGRYRLLETLRHYGQERLATDGAANDALRARHLKYFLRLAEEPALGMRGPDHAKWSDRLELDHDNLRAGLKWGKAPDAPRDRVELALHLAGTLYIPSLRRGFSREARKHLESLLAHCSAQQPTRTRARALFAVGSLAMWQDRDDVAANFDREMQGSEPGLLGD
ncbi:MAG: adenylate/guanylate cyclase domain-containing protein [Pedosphaera sp.]|nr:adenylate/guanylate cyclase domain-containing protein [Pedosphaera sp.]